MALALRLRLADALRRVARLLARAAHYLAAPWPSDPYAPEQSRVLDAVVHELDDLAGDACEVR